MSPPRPLRRLPAAPVETPCSAAAVQLAYEQPYNEAQKLEFAFRYAERAAQRLDERVQLDRLVADALDRLRDEQKAQTARLEEALAAMGDLAELVRDDLLASDRYSCQAVESLDRLCTTVRDLSRRIGAPAAVAIAAAAPPPPAIVVIGPTVDDEGAALERAA